MDQNKINIDDFIDVSGIQKGIDQIDKSMKQLDATISKIKESNKDSVDPKTFSEYNKELEKTKKETTELEKIKKQITVAEQKLSDEYIEQAKELARLREEQKKKIKEDKEEEGSINALRKANKELTEQRNKVNLQTKEGRAELKRLNAEIDKNNKVIESNVDALTKQKIGIGAYKDHIIEAAKAMFSPAGIIAAVTTATITIYQFIDGITKARKEVQSLTKLTGKELTDLTSSIRATASTFDVDFNEVLVATNSLSKSMGITFKESIDLINKGFASGANATGDFLEQIKEYPIQFKQAGITAEQTIAIISKSIEQGIFTDTGANVIKEVTLRLREMPKATADAINGIGLSSKEIADKLKKGTISIFDAIKMVSNQMAKLPPQSKAVGTAIADIFGGPGEDAGLPFLISLGSIETSLDKVVEKTGELGKSQMEAVKATEELNKAFDKLIGTGTSKIQTLGTYVKKGLTFYINELADAWAGLFDMWDRRFGKVKQDTENVRGGEGYEIPGQKKSMMFDYVVPGSNFQEKQKEETKKLTEEQLKIITTANKKRNDEQIKLLDQQRSNDEEYLAWMQSEKEKELNQAKEYADIEQQIDQDILDSKKAKKEQELKDFKEKEEEKRRIQQETFELGKQLTNEIYSYISTKQSNEIQQLEENKAKEIALAGDNANKKAKIEKKYDREIAAIKRRQAINDRNAALTNIIVDTAKGIMAVWGQQNVPYWVKIAQSLIVGGIGLAQTGKVMSTKIPSYGKGKIDIDGKSHSEGGIIAEIEGGESVITKKATRKYKGTLTAINENKAQTELIKAFMSDIGRNGGVSQEIKITNDVNVLGKKLDRLNSTIKNQSKVIVNVNRSGAEYIEKQGFELRKKIDRFF